MITPSSNNNNHILQLSQSSAYDHRQMRLVPISPQMMQGTLYPGTNPRTKNRLGESARFSSQSQLAGIVGDQKWTAFCERVAQRKWRQDQESGLSCSKQYGLSEDWRLFCSTRFSKDGLPSVYILVHGSTMEHDNERQAPIQEPQSPVNVTRMGTGLYT